MDRTACKCLMVWAIGVWMTSTSTGAKSDQGTVRAVNGVKYPFQDPGLPWDRRVDDLVGRLTIDEVARQSVDTVDKIWTSAVPRLGIKPYVWDTECLHGQRATNTTAFPQALGLAASFSPQLIHNMSEALSVELRAHWNGNRARGVYLRNMGLSCYSPVINIMRHPLWGRNQETFGEDPLLSGTLAASFIRGLHGRHPRYQRATGGCKHFDVHGGPDNIPVSRFAFDANVSTADWRMTFLPQFKACVDAGVHNLMCSYNSINGIPACANKQLLTDILRGEWGFKGFVVSDNPAIYLLRHGHHYVSTDLDAVTAAIGAGCNMELSETKNSLFPLQVEAVQQGTLTERQLRENIRPMMYTRMKLGEFDPERMNPYNAINMSAIQSVSHREQAVTAAMMSFVLLKNDQNSLPLKKTSYSKIAVIGPFANNTEELFGDYSSDILTKYTTTVYQGLSRLAKSSALGLGCSNTRCTHYDSLPVKHAIEGAELVFVALGTGPSVEKEGRDRENLKLPGQQLQILKDAAKWAKNKKPVILLLFNAGPVDLSWAKHESAVRVILECFFPAQSTGQALLRVLTASGPHSIPAGRLPATWPTSLQQVPPITDYSMRNRTYRYFEEEPLYPFGYGLSYATYVYENLSVSASQICPGDDVGVTVEVTNTGTYTAEEVVQVYISWTRHKNPHTPRLQLVNFCREFIQPQQRRLFRFTIKAHQMALWSEEMDQWYTPLGPVMVYVGGQQPHQRTRAPSNVLQTSFSVVKCQR